MAEALLVATGRAPNVEGLGLDAAGVDGDAVRGVHVDDHLRTRNPSIHACGDVCLESKFTHMADFSACIVIRNALFALGPLGRRRVTYTDPEIVQVGLGLRGIQNGRTAFDVFTVPFDSVDRSITEDETEGFARVWVARRTDRILGATLVGTGAGELASELTLALSAGLGLSAIAATIRPDPTRPRCFGSWATSTSEPVSLRGDDPCFMGSTRWVGGWAEAPEAVPPQQWPDPTSILEIPRQGA